MICPHCGRSVPEAAFCTECGGRMDARDAQNSSYGSSYYGTMMEPVRSIGFGEAVRSYFKNYAVFSGRATRSEYWFVFLFNLVVGAVLGLFSGLFGDSFLGALFSGISGLYGLAVIIPSLALSWRRLHDIGKSGAWYFIGLVPLVGFIILLVFYCTDSKPDNEYGPRKTESNRNIC